MRKSFRTSQDGCTFETKSLQMCMLKILQATMIPVLLCANLLGDEYGVEKWATPLGTALEWGMTSKEAQAVMKKKGFKFRD